MLGARHARLVGLDDGRNDVILDVPAGRPGLDQIAASGFGTTRMSTSPARASQPSTRSAREARGAGERDGAAGGGGRRYREALEERTRERAPLDWATTQSNLGDALRTLGERESGTARLEEAVGVDRAALE